ncbi:DUF1638 domain-containing protein [Carboxydothermus pertinax]|uniref:DUF1638 domain-containing protein n=1 Tax=Carboxydothermus pertinax TaxID=870242 RepID=A0A1L8CWG2_9THEO|nr:DUF1638 domain-containing protein [Carboxydothermus pertinax]GAV23252.1 hypothetical protein cpu_17620 [Carboxydothermus pertinax]
MSKCLICCGILQKELEQIFKEIGNRNNVPERIYLEPALHVDFDKLKTELESTLANQQKKSEKLFLVYGLQCHPEMKVLAQNYKATVIPAQNCIDMLLGDKINFVNQEAKTFFLTPGWLENWKSIFINGLGWDSITARQNFGFYERILLLDTGIKTFKEEEILEFFDYTQIPIETHEISLHNLRQLVLDTLK